jgi:hypothetical protein
MIENDARHIAKRQLESDKREYKLRLLASTLTMFIVLAIASMATLVIMNGHNVAGSVLATVDLVALANVFINSWKR